MALGYRRYWRTYPNIPLIPRLHEGLLGLGDPRSWSNSSLGIYPSPSPSADVSETLLRSLSLNMCGFNDELRCFNEQQPGVERSYSQHCQFGRSEGKTSVHLMKVVPARLRPAYGVSTFLKPIDSLE
nr:unnamed protein product [Callosobruchus analis]